MLNEIIVGRDEYDFKKFGMKGTGYIAKHIVGDKHDARSEEHTSELQSH